jgi:hypothetical protein
MPTDLRMATCHSDRKHKAKGLCKQCWNATHYLAHREEKKAYNATYAATHREQRAARYLARREKNLDWMTARDNALKLAVFNAYGGPQCACCGETLLRGLQIDHVNGGGAAWRKTHSEIPRGHIYRWLREHGYPPGFQVLCATCNFAKGTGDHCPHQDVQIGRTN